MTDLRKLARGKPCMVDGCNRKQKTKGICQMHYFRLHRTGSSVTEPYSIRKTRTMSRFDESYIPVPFSGCWLWIKCISNSGYGKFTLDNKTILAHRASFVLFKGSIENGMNILHKCDTKCCVNPEHLYAGSFEENIRDRQIRDRCNKKLSKVDIESIRNDSNTTRIIGRKYGVTSATISEIKRRKIWRHV